jgi:CHAD domain-containing protein
VSVADRSATPPGELTALLLAWTGGDPVAAVATLRTRRLTWTVRNADGHERAEVVDDEVEVLDGRRVLDRFREVEIERRGVRTEYVDRIARRLARAGAERVTTPKLARVLPSLAPVAVPRVRRSGPVAALVTAALAEAGGDLLAADVGARLGAEDAVHQLRVACRRMRSVLRGYGPVLDPAWRDALGTALHDVGAALAAARDAEVVAARLTAAAGDLGAAAGPLLADLATRRAAAAGDVVTVLSGEAYVGLARQVRTELASPPFVEPDAARPAREAAAEVVDGALRDLRRAVRRARAPGAPDAEWHAVRIAAKRLRYAAETAAPVAGAEARRLARAASAVQDVLGAFHDATCGVAVLTGLAGERPDDGAYALVAGRLVERELRAADAARAGLGPVWRRAVEPAARRWRKR